MKTIGKFIYGVGGMLSGGFFGFLVARALVECKVTPRSEHLEILLMLVGGVLLAAVLSVDGDAT
jgi:NhaP-type Na+/H+ or K+/H+ antiporter